MQLEFSRQILRKRLKINLKYLRILMCGVDSAGLLLPVAPVEVFMAIPYRKWY
jgi:hypothetical protein